MTYEQAYTLAKAKRSIVNILILRFILMKGLLLSWKNSKWKTDLRLVLANMTIFSPECNHFRHRQQKEDTNTTTSLKYLGQIPNTG